MAGVNKVFFIASHINRLMCLTSFFVGRTRSFFRTKDYDIVFVCGFHGDSGGAHAIANIANLLASERRVAFVSNPFSNYNRLLSEKVTLVSTIEQHADIYLTDLSLSVDILKKIKSMNKTVLMSIHGFKDRSHKLDQAHVEQATSLADYFHFVSDHQASSFSLDVSKCRVIPNTTKRINKEKYSCAIGTVGNLNNPEKRVKDTIAIGLKSKAEKIHLWFKDKNEEFVDRRVVFHKSESNKTKIFNSFDVLVFMSELETFGLVVIEAMSAGIPCILSPIPAFQQFADCPGVEIIQDWNSDVAAERVDYYLDNKMEYKDEIIEFFNKNFSEQAVREIWLDYIHNILRK